MERVGIRTRLVVAGVIVAAALGFALGPRPADAGPGPCGNVLYGTGGPTSTKTVVSYCAYPACGGPFVHQPHTTVDSIEYGGFVCISLP